MGCKKRLCDCGLDLIPNTNQPQNVNKQNLHVHGLDSRMFLCQQQEEFLFNLPSPSQHLLLLLSILGHLFSPTLPKSREASITSYRESWSPSREPCSAVFHLQGSLPHSPTGFARSSSFTILSHENLNHLINVSHR